MKYHPILCASLILIANVHGAADTYTVKAGDNFAKIARQAGCTPNELARLNQLKVNSIIRPGQKLKLPGKSGNQATVAVEGFHTIQSGDTLSSISRRHQMSLDSLLALNPGVDSKSLQLGQKIRLSTATPSSREQALPVAATQTISNPKPATKANTTAPVAAEIQSNPPKNDEPESVEKVRSFMIDAEITFGQFAANHGTTIARLNDLNGYDLTAATVLAKGSEVYVPIQP